MKENNVIKQIVNSILAEGTTVNMSGWHTDAWEIPS